LQGDWDDMRADEDGILNNSDLVSLGSGRFRVARLFQKEYEEVSEGGFICTRYDKFVVLTGCAMHYKLNDVQNILYVGHLQQHTIAYK
jgi:hypothetical protein